MGYAKGAEDVVPILLKVVPAGDLLAHGEHPKVVSERLGHYDPAFTLRVYSHVLPGIQAQTAMRLEERLFGQKTPK
jgi:integrase